MKISIMILCVGLLLAGCEEQRGVDSQNPRGFNDLPRPVIIIAANEGGLAVLDGNGDMHSWCDNYYFTRPFWKSGLKKGDVLLPERYKHQDLN